MFLRAPESSCRISRKGTFVDFEIEPNRDAARVRYKTKATRSKFARSCRVFTLRVSLESRYFSGPRLQSILTWMQKQTHVAIHYILVSDVLMRHNYIATTKITEQCAYEKSKKNGFRWEKMNHAHLNDFRSKVGGLNLLYWSDIISDADFRELHKGYALQLKDNVRFDHELNRDAERYVNARRQKGRNLDWELMYETSRQYLLEEIAAHRLLLERYGGCHLYPSDGLFTEKYLSETTDQIPLELRFPDDYFVRLKVERRSAV